MAPAQPFTDIEQDCKPCVNAKVELRTENRNSLENSSLEDIPCMSNRDDNCIRMKSVLNGTDEALMCIADVDVDIIECGNNHNYSLKAETEDPDATEYSSSFADTVSDTENFSEGEVESQSFPQNGLTSAFDAFSSAFQMRKKKLTNHWRTFIRPVMWRCKWMELRIKEIESQELNYSRALAAYDQRKRSAFDQFILEESGSTSLPFSSQGLRKKSIKRRKRKRIEETTDIASYISHHNAFSYFENKRSDPDSTSLADEFSNAVITEHSADYNDKLSTADEWSLLEFRDGDKSLEHVLWKIETLHSWVHKLKNQIDVVMPKTAAIFSSSENLSIIVPCDGQTSSAHSPAFSAGNGDGIYATTQQTSEFNIGDLVMPESVVSSFGDALPAPDIIESSVGLLSATDAIFHQPQFSESSEDIVDNVLIHNAAEGEKRTFRRMTDEPIENHQQQPEEGKQEGPCATPSSTVESCLGLDVNFPRNKRKRGERRTGSDVWSKKCSGEPGSQ
ncbi:hypothetical protein RchiOBHm_Chr7g0224241 [Rosa chinensis]|uniref:Uncharacterized protein n=1 Tax=Rosa chinensis TaxID=74649 RepID=A0A2P6PDS3_ROSCH|nr:uncharacterized protein LOC112178724 isoform X1 [Rosa chinensis]PRQ20078.1 hypothetical protein RchiOBHm_Chr7g0224241 [Rosa chinensis]